MPTYSWRTIASPQALFATLNPQQFCNSSNTTLIPAFFPLRNFLSHSPAKNDPATIRTMVRRFLSNLGVNLAAGFLLFFFSERLFWTVFKPGDLFLIW